MKKQILQLAMCLVTGSPWAQNVGIGTTAPDASAALEIKSTNKGLLIPRVYLSSTIDNTAVPLPAHGLLVYNQSTVLTGGEGFFFNGGVPGSPNWKRLSDIVLPYYNAVSATGNAFRIDNYSQTGTSTGIYAYSAGGIGLYAYSDGPTGLYAYCASGNALETSGKLKFAGNGLAPAAGKVLTSDATGNATWEGNVAFCANGVQGGGNQAIPYNTYRKVAFFTEKYDLSNDYNNADQSPYSTFIAPVNGIYHFDAHVSWAANNESSVYAMLLRTNDGGTHTISEQIGKFGASSIDNISVSTDVKVNAGGQVWVEVYHTVSDPMNLITDAEYSHFDGRMVIKL